MKHILVVGAGPAGAAVSLLLAQQGIRVTLLEKETAFERVFRGEGLMPAGLDALYQMGLKDTFESISVRQLTSWDFYVGGKRRMRVVEPDQGGLATRIMDQGALLQAIVTKAKQLPNFEFYPGWQVSDLIRDESNTVVGVRATCSGEPKDFLADAVIACDGRYSRLRKLAGLEIQQSPAQFDVLWFKLPAPLSLAQETPFVACLQPDSQFAFYPSWDGRLQIGWIVEKNAQKSAQKLAQNPAQNPAQNLAQKQAGLAKLKERDWIEAFAQALPTELAQHFRTHKDELEGPIYLDVQVGCCEQWSIPGLLLIGDAAHPMAPNRAQGINMALRDAIVVANHLANLGVNPGAQEAEVPVPSAVLQSIESVRQPEIEAVQKMQLAEWRKVEFISRPGLPYWGFKALVSTFGGFKFAQNIWLHEQKGLRDGVLPVRLQFADDWLK